MRTCVLVSWALVAALVLASNHVHAAAFSCPAAASYPASQSPNATCAAYQPVHPDGSLAFCNGIVNYPFFLPTGRTQAQLDALAQQNLIGSNPSASLLLSVLPQRCQLQLKKTICLAAFMACEYVDPYFLDTACPPGSVCTTCGGVSGVNSVADLFTPLTLSPAYGSYCMDETSQPNPVSGTTVNRCIVSPGKVPGMGNLGWETLKAMTAPTVPSMELYCLSQGLVWSLKNKACMAAVPRSPCKGECEKLWSMDRTVGLGPNGVPTLVNSPCPIVSGNFTALLTFLAAANPDPYVQAQATTALSGATGGRTSVSLLGAFGLGPQCNANLLPTTAAFAFSTEYIQERTPDRLVSLGQAMLLQIGRLNASAPFNACHCVKGVVSGEPGSFVETSTVSCDTTLDSTYCAQLATRTAKCNSQSGSTPPDAGLRFVGVNEGDMNPICKRVVTSTENQPSNATLDLIKLAFGLPSREAATGVFFVPPVPGLPVLSTGQMQRPLCAIPNNIPTGEVFTGNDSYTCTLASVKSAAQIVPPILRGKCRAAFLDMLCNTAHMKIEMKTMCLVAPGVGSACESSDVAGAATNRMPFIFALPRFPSKFLCTNFKQECAGFLAQAGPIGTPRRDALEAAFNCDGTIEQTCARNNPIPPSWSSGSWSCSSPLNGVASYPSTFQGLADMNALLQTYGADNGMTQYLAFLGASTVTNATISSSTSTLGSQDLCECPFPLVVPDDPNAPTEGGLCCTTRCESHMYSREQSDTIILIQKVVSIMSIIGTSFIIATWGTFKVKRSQPLTFFFAVASFNISLMFIIPLFSKSDVREVWCRDNTQQNTQEDGGMCLFQSIWLTFWVIAACSFWLVQGFDLFLRIVKGQRHLDHLTKYYHMFAWGLPTALLAVMLGNQAAGYETTYYWCFMRDFVENEELGRGLDLGLFYGTIIAIWFTGAVLMMLVLYKIYTITSKTSGTAQVSNTALKRLTMYRTPVFFVVFFVYVWASIFAWRFSAEAKASTIRDAGRDWVGCLLSNFAAGITNPAFDARANVTLLTIKWGLNNGTGCGDSFPFKIPYADYVYVMCITGLQGVFIFFIFGAKVENFNLWKEKLGLTTKKYDTTADQDSSTKDRTAKPSILSNAMSSMFSPASPTLKSNDSVEKDGGGSAVMVNGLQSGKFMAVTEPDVQLGKIKSNQVAAAYMHDD